MRHTRPLLALTCAALARCSSAPPPTPAPTLTLDVVEKEAPTIGLAGALAYAEFVDGTNELETADSNGHVVFTGHGIASGVASVSAATDASRIITSVVAPDLSAPLTIPLALITLPTFTLSGTVTPKNVGDGVLMQSSLGGFWGVLHAASESPYSMMNVQPGGLLTMYGAEGNYSDPMFARGVSFSLVEFFHFDHPGLTADTTFDFDINTLPADPAVTVSGTVAIPGGDAGPLGGASTILVIVVGDPGAQGAIPVLPNIGESTALGMSTDNNAFTYSLTYSPYPNVTPYVYVQISQIDGSTSARSVAGFPTDNQVIDGLALPPEIPDAVQEGTLIDTTTAPVGTVATLFASDATGLLYYAPSAQWVVSLPVGKASPMPGLPDAMKSILPPNLRVALNVAVSAPRTPFVAGNAAWSRGVSLTP